MKFDDEFYNFCNFRLSSETLAEVEQKDIYVRLQEIFRDRKVALDQSMANIEQHYEHIVQVTMLQEDRQVGDKYIYIYFLNVIFDILYHCRKALLS